LRHVRDATAGSRRVDGDLTALLAFLHSSASLLGTAFRWDPIRIHILCPFASSTYTLDDCHRILTCVSGRQHRHQGLRSFLASVSVLVWSEAAEEVPLRPGEQAEARGSWPC
jgi:hypothetical protein